jgi:hypothetical protein
MEPVVEKNSAGTGVIWGVGLIVLGALALFSRFVPAFSELMWAAAFGAGAAILFRVYRRHTGRWWLLIPAYGLAALAGLVGIHLLHYTWLETRTVELLIPAYLFWVAAYPFYWLARAGKLPAWLALLLSMPFVLFGTGFLLAAVGPAIPALMIVGGLYLLLRARRSAPVQSAASTVQAEPAPAPVATPKADR